MTTHVLTNPSSGINYCNRVVANNTLPASTATVYLGRMISPVLSKNFSPTGLSGKADDETPHKDPRTRKCRTILTHSVMDNGSPKSYRASDVYADLISQPGNRDDPNDIVPDMLVRMPGEVGLLKGRSLVIQQEGVIKRYSRDTPLGGQLLQQSGRKPDYVPLEDTVHVYLEACDKGDDLYRKILASVRQADPSDIGAEEVAEFRQQVAGFIRNHPDLAEDANNALEDDDLYTLPIDDAITEYNERPHPDDPVYLDRPARPWLEPLLYLLNGGMPVFHNGIRALVGSQNASGTTAVEFPEHPAIQTFQTYIDNHRNLDKLIVNMDDALSQEDKVPALSDQRKYLIQTGKALSKQLKDTLEYGATLSRGTSVKVLEWLLEFSQIPADDQDAAHPHRNTPAGSHPASMPETGTVRPAPSKPTITGIFDTVQGYVRDTANYVDSYFRFPMAEAVSIPANGSRTIESEPDFECSLNESSNVESTLVSNGAGVDAGTVPGNRTLLSVPAYKIPPFDQNNPNITVSEQAYEYSRLVLGLVQLRLAELEDYQQPFHIVPVLADAGSQSIEYRSIYLPEVSEQDVNDLANPDPNGPEPGQGGRAATLAHRLGETIYQSSLWDRLLYPEFGTGAVKSTESINEVINNLYHFTPGLGYQLDETELTYQQVLTGRSNARQAIQNSIDADGSRDENRLVSSGAATHSRESTSPGLELYSTVYNSINDFVSRLFESDSVYRQEDFLQNFGEDLLQNFGREALKGLQDLPYSKRRDLLSKYTQACHQQRKPVTLLPISQLAQYLEFLQAVSPDEPALRLTDNVWVRTRDASGLDFLIPYTVDEVLSGVLSGYDPEQLKLPPQLALLSDLVVQETWPEVLQEACLRLTDSHETVESYLQRSRAERRAVSVHDQKMLKSYLNLLLPDCMARPHLSITAAAGNLTIHDQVWVKSEHDNTHSLFPYAIKEVLSGAVTGYEPHQLILPSKLEPYRHFITHANFNEIMHETYLAHCSARSIATNNAPAKYLAQCQHFNDRLQDNLFIRNTLNWIVDDIIEYQDDLYTKVAEQLEDQEGTALYEDSQLEAFITQLEVLAAQEKQRLIDSHGHTPKTTPPEVLESYVPILEDAAKMIVQEALEDSPETPEPAWLSEDNEPLQLSTRVWYKSEIDGIRVLVPYTLKEVFTGMVTGFDPLAFIAPPQLEPAVIFMTSRHFAGKMHRFYLQEKVLKVLEPIQNDLDRVLSQQWFLKGEYERLAQEAGYGWMEMTQQVGYVLPAVGLGSYMPYTPYDFLVNTAQLRSAELTMDQFYPVENRFNLDHARDFFKLLAKQNTKIEGAYNDFINGLKTNEDFQNRIKEVMRLNIPLSPTYNELRTSEHAIYFGSALDLQNINPFITVFTEYRFWGMTGKIILFSYLTGAQIKLPESDFAAESSNPDSDIFKWLMMHGGLTFRQQFLNEGPPRTVGFTGLGGYPNNMKSVFIEAAPERLFETACFNMDSLTRTYDEIQRATIFEIVRFLGSFIGFIPAVGDMVEIAAALIIDEIEIQMEDSPLERYALRREQMETLGISSAMSLIPGVTFFAVRNVVKVVLKNLNVSWLKKIIKGASRSGVEGYHKHIDYPTKNLFDGLPNRKLDMDIDGNPIPRKIEPNSKAFNRLCGARRKKRAPDLFCGLWRSSSHNMTQQELQDKVYKPKNLKFATKQDGRLPTLYFSSKKYGTGSLRQQHISGAKIADINKHQSHVFFSNEQDLDDFVIHLDDTVNKKGFITREDFSLARSTFNGRNQPKNGDYHYDIIFESSKADAIGVDGHYSAGTVIIGEQLEVYRKDTAAIYQLMKDHLNPAI